MGLAPVDPTTIPGWDEMVSSHPGASVFHTAAWAGILADAYGYRPLYLVDRAGAGSSPSILPLIEVRSPLTGRRGVCLPFSDSVPPLVEDGGDLANLLAEASSIGRNLGWRYLEIRGGKPVRPGIDPSVIYAEHVLRLDRPAGDLFQSLRENMRRNVRKAGSEGVTVDFGHSGKHIEEYFRLHCLTRKMHGLPPQPIRFFRLLGERLLSRGMGFVALARRRGVAVAGAIHLQFGTRMDYKFGASDAEGRRCRANVLLMWESIRKGAGEGMRELSFGRTDTAHSGLAEFKKGFGAVERSLPYYRLDPKTGAPLAAPSLGTNRLAPLFRIMPIAASRFLGSILYRHTG